MKVSLTRLGAFATVAMIVMQGPAFAHHAMGGKMPDTFLQGLLSGLAHPIIGLDHLAAVVGVGILAALARRGIVSVLAFSAALIAGVAVHLGKIDIPASELLVGLSTLAIGALVATRRDLGAPAAAGLFAIAGLVHGYALGESIVGAEPSPLVAYLAGLLVIQTLISLAAYRLVGRTGRALTIALGALVALAGGVSAAFAAGALA